MQPQSSSCHYSLQLLSANSRKSLQIPAPPCNVSLYALQKIAKAQRGIGAAEHLAHHWELHLKPMTNLWQNGKESKAFSEDKTRIGKHYDQNLHLL